MDKTNKGDQMEKQELVNIEKELKSVCCDCKSKDVYKIIDMIVRTSGIDDRFKAGICKSCYGEALGGDEL